MMIFPEYAKTRTDAKAIEGGRYIRLGIFVSSSQEIKKNFAMIIMYVKAV
jgi:hypothetical protein